jgi:hypothetical protein
VFKGLRVRAGSFGLICALLPIGSASAMDIFLAPDCPAPNEKIEIVAYAATGGLDGSTPTVTRDGTNIRIVGGFSNTSFSPDPPAAYAVSIGPLPVGTYEVSVFLRANGSPAQPSTEILQASRTFTVFDHPPACTPQTMVISTAQFQSVPVGVQVFPEPITVQIFDKDQRPVPGVTVYLNDYSWFSADDENPLLDVTLSATHPVTDPDGKVVVMATSSGQRGLRQISVAVASGQTGIQRFFTLASVGPMASAGTVTPVVEYFRYYSGGYHYFLTADPAEMALLDSDKVFGWQRHGTAFLAYKPGQGAAAGASPVCRFYGLPKAGLDSHFFSAAADECDAVTARFGDAWLLETANAFEIILPNRITGACPTGTNPIYRLYNNKPDANHFYAAAKSVRDGKLVGLGYVSEGYGPNGVTMCAPL